MSTYLQITMYVFMIFILNGCLGDGLNTKDGSEATPNTTFPWVGTKQAGVPGPINTDARGAATDSNDNVFILGYTDGALDGQVKTSNAGYMDSFLSKYNSSGTRIWTRQLGVMGAFNTMAEGVSTDFNGNIYFAGNTDGGLDGQTKMSDANYYDSFVSKYNSSGERIWTRQLGTAGQDHTYASKVATDSSGNVYIVGYATGPVDGQTKMSDTLYYDFFVTKYSSAGTIIWTRQLGISGAFNTFGMSVAVDLSGNVFVGGYTSGALDGQIKTSGASYTDFFITKYTSSGAKSWTRQLGSPGSKNTYGYRLGTDSSGNVFIGGNTNGALDGEAKISDATNSDFFITKYNSSGTKSWTRQLGIPGAFAAEINGFTTDQAGNVFISGGTDGALDGQTKTSDASGYDFFLTKFDSSGAKSWTKQLGAPGVSSTYGNGLAIDSRGNVFVTGSTNGTLDGQIKTSDAGASDYFITKYNSSGVKQ